MEILIFHLKDLIKYFITMPSGYSEYFLIFFKKRVIDVFENLFLRKNGMIFFLWRTFFRCNRTVKYIQYDVFLKLVYSHITALFSCICLFEFSLF